MTPEQRLWRYIRDGMKGRWSAQRHEDRLTAGVPDVSFGIAGVQGWIELKVLSRWPMRETTFVRIRKFTPAQRLWLIERGRAGGRCFLLIQIGDDYLLLPSAAIRTEDQRTRDELTSVGYLWTGRIVWDEFASILKKAPGSGAV